MTSPRESGSDEVLRRASRLGAIHADSGEIAIDEATLEQILSFSEQGGQREIGGFLLGDIMDAPRTRTWIRHFLPATETRSQAASLTFTHETWATLHREAEQRFSKAVVVGWHHTHPNLGVFLSANDLFIHRHFFAEPWHVALVVDPVRQDFGFFQWRQGRVENCGFVCLHD